MTAGFKFSRDSLHIVMIGKDDEDQGYSSLMLASRSDITPLFCNKNNVTMGIRLEKMKQVMRIVKACGCITLLSKIIIINTNNEKIIG